MVKNEDVLHSTKACDDYVEHDYLSFQVPNINETNHFKIHINFLKLKKMQKSINVKGRSDK